MDTLDLRLNHVPRGCPIPVIVDMKTELKSHPIFLFYEINSLRSFRFP
ncbi:rCG61522, partial [Rattus norvegicus]